MVQCHRVFQDLLKKGMELGKMKDTEGTREDGKKTTKLGNSGMIMEGVGAEGQVEMTEEDTVMVKVAHQATLNEEEMQGVKVGFKVRATAEHNMEVKVGHVDANVIENIGVAKVEALGEITAVVEKGTVVEAVDNKMNEMVDVVVKTETVQGI